MDRKQRDELKALEDELKEKREDYLSRLSGLPFSLFKLSEEEREVFTAELIALKQDIARLEAVVMETYQGESKKAREKYEEALEKSKRWKWFSNNEPEAPQIGVPKCNRCKGNGYESIRCSNCNGKGHPARWENSIFPPKCEWCNGTGKIKIPCSYCKGVGHL